MTKSDRADSGRRVPARDARRLYLGRHHILAQKSLIARIHPWASNSANLEEMESP